VGVVRKKIAKALRWATPSNWRANSTPDSNTASTTGRDTCAADLVGNHKPASLSPRRWPPSEEQADAFLSWLIKTQPGTRILARTLQDEIYPMFCRESRWQPRPWREVAKHLKAATGGRKYAYVYDEAGRSRHWRVYSVPSAAEVSETTRHYRAA
jgi:hypothetical protein